MIATLLDFDGVLVDSEPVHLAAFNDVLARRGIAIDEREYVEHYLSLDDAGVFRAVLSSGGLTLREEEVRACVAAKAPRFMARFESAFKQIRSSSLGIVSSICRGGRGSVVLIDSRTSRRESPRNGFFPVNNS